ncbi:hypothetical protein NMD1_01738 [Novosphingobium sp. MD-1]|nr:hypothetical protein NMD1_01738 [Novosphingobium sp. MD-1]
MSGDVARALRQAQGERVWGIISFPAPLMLSLSKYARQPRSRTP